MHFLSLVLFPPPHVLEQSDQVLHPPQDGEPIKQKQIKITMSDGNAYSGTFFARILAGVDVVNIGNLLVHLGGVSKVDLHIDPGGACVILI